ncbi:cysteine desulfurase [Lichenihabitans sp. PAMC28606]|nr:cysteine desulfurase [Lichenihabitans sp. PAMC28606]
MSRPRTYLDFNATSPLRPVARIRMIEALDRVGNPSSVHTEGRRARGLVETARADVAALFGTRTELVTFTSGTTEAAALALTPVLQDAPVQAPADRLLVAATEHPAVLQGHRFPADRVSLLPVTSDGLLDLEALRHALASVSGRCIVAVQAANSETGVLQPIHDVADLVHAHGGLLVCDATQAAGRIDCSFNRLQADVLLVSSHKIGGPLGVGAMVFASDRLRLGDPLVRGGGQERGLRGGTENVPAIAGFGAAARAVSGLVDTPHLYELRQNLEQRLRASWPDVVMFGNGAERLPNTVAFAIPGVSNETALIALDLEGVAVSTGSACSSGKVSSSHVLEAMGVDAHLRACVIRVSFGWCSIPADVDRLMVALGAIASRIQRRSTQAAA